MSIPAYIVASSLIIFFCIVYFPQPNPNPKKKVPKIKTDNKRKDFGNFVIFAKNHFIITQIAINQKTKIEVLSKLKTLQIINTNHIINLIQIL